VTSLLQAHRLAIGYASRVVGRGFELALRGGEVLALLGPNGCGKTTLLKTLLGLIPAKAGSVTLNDKPLAEHSIGERARLVAYVPQQHASAFAFSVEDLVLMGRTAHGGLFAGPTARDREVTRAAVERLGIAHLAAQPVTQVSGGERQLALIARALAQQARIVLLDEPTASLDFGNQGLVMREIRRLAADGLAVLFTTHDPNHALRFADRALLIRDGGTLVVGPVAEVLARDVLQELYGASVEQIGDGERRAFLPS
jgi:iron complex transport system ATP-binding protein